MRGRAFSARLVLSLVAAAATPPAAQAFDFFDGRVQVHGFVEEQIRGIARGFSTQDNLDLTQWYNILNIETDVNAAPNGWGPFDLIHAYTRVEVRYDCIWTRGCGIFPQADVYGDRAETLPGRYSDGQKTGLTGAVFTGDTRRLHVIPVDELGFPFKDDPVPDRRLPAFLWNVPRVDTLFGVPGSDGVLGTADDPAFFVFQRFLRPGREYRFGLREVKGTDDSTIQVLGPWLPRNHIDSLAYLSDRPNPFNPLDFNPIAGAGGSFGSGALPYRPAPELPDGVIGRSPLARGLYIPNEAVAHVIQTDKLGQIDQNFSQTELAFNHGQSQQQTGELKEAYVDLEAFDSRLWMRIGKQDIVWGKTELFRTTDQFNPQDLALSSLPDLKESRIALWSARAVWSFYQVGPLDDVRLEGAVNFDKFQPNDLGRCGEPYTPYPACNITAGLFAHGLAGFGLAGVEQPPDPWDSWKGLDGGMRLEFRWDRFSFALTDFYGYDDVPYVKPLFYYERNVDPLTGWPRRGNTTAGCDPDHLFGEGTSGCLGPGEDALKHSSANQQRFAVICASSVGFNNLDPSACAQSIFNSSSSALTGVPNTPPTVAEALGMLISGSAIGKALVATPSFVGTTVWPAVTLNRDVNDGPGQGTFAGAGTLGQVLTDQQEALLGCGRFWGTSCDTSLPKAGGIDLMNAELSVLIQSFPGTQGTSGNWTTTNTHVAQPGTLGFVGGAVARRYQDGRSFVLPGARSPFAATNLDPKDWSAGVDGCVRASDPGCAASNGGTGAHDLRQPFTGVFFQSEMAALSWNYLLTLVVLSGQGKAQKAIDEFLPSDPFGLTRPGSCSYTMPQLCSNVQAIFAVAHTTRKTLRAGGNGAYGRADWDWDTAGSGVLAYNKRNVLGFSSDFAEDRTKSTWSFEATWIEGNKFQDNNSFDGLHNSDTYNLTISIDRPTFVHFLNPDRTFFINTQWFLQYVPDYRGSFTTNGPFNALATLHVDTGYYRDRLLPGITLVYDFNSDSGAVLPQVSYRFTDSFSATLSLSYFFGRFQGVDAPIASINDQPFRTGSGIDRDWVENGLAPIRDRDEIALRIRYTF